MHRCPACEGEKTLRLFGVKLPLPDGPLASTIRSCRACGHRWLDTTAEIQPRIDNRDEWRFRTDPATARRIRDELREIVVPRVPPPARLLDVGCGAGEFLAAAVEAGYDGEGVDISPAAIDLCRLRGLNVRAGDFATLSYDRTFDVITLCDILVYLREPGNVLRRARRLLSPTGRLVVKVPAFGWLTFPPIAVWGRLAGTLLGAPSHIQYFTPRSLSVMLTTCGFGEAENLPETVFQAPEMSGGLRRRAGRMVTRTLNRVAQNASLFVAVPPG